MCNVNVTGGVCPQEEINAYIARGAAVVISPRLLICTEDPVPFSLLTAKMR